MNDIGTYGAGLFGVATAYAGMNPFFWIALVVGLRRGWSTDRSAVIGFMMALLWGFLIYSVQKYVALNSGMRGAVASNQDWFLRIIVMAVISAILLTVYIYIIGLLWRWLKVVFGEVRVTGHAAYDNVRNSAPGMVESAKERYRAYREKISADDAGDDAFEIAGKELRINRPIESLWAKSLMRAGGDSERAKSIYIKLRVEQISIMRNQ